MSDPAQIAIKNIHANFVYAGSHFELPPGHAVIVPFEIGTALIEGNEGVLEEIDIVNIPDGIAQFLPVNIDGVPNNPNPVGSTEAPAETAPEAPTEESQLEKLAAEQEPVKTEEPAQTEPEAPAEVIPSQVEEPAKTEEPAEPAKTEPAKTEENSAPAENS